MEKQIKNLENNRIEKDSLQAIKKKIDAYQAKNEIQKQVD